MSFGVVLFHTTSAAFRAERTLHQAGLAIKLVPTPRHLSSDCGMAVRFEWVHRSTVEQLLVDAHVELSALHPL